MLLASSGLLLYAPFPLLALCPFAILNLSCEHDYVLSPMSLTDLVVSIGTPNTVVQT